MTARQRDINSTENSFEDVANACDFVAWFDRRPINLPGTISKNEGTARHRAVLLCLGQNRNGAKNWPKSWQGCQSQPYKLPRRPSQHGARAGHVHIAAG